MSYVKTSVKYICIFFFPSNQQLQHTPKQVKMDVSFWVKHVHVHLRQQQHWRVIFPHSGFLLLQCFYKPQVQNIQEHVVILLSNNCAVFVVHFWPVFDITSMPWHEDLILNLSCPQRLSFYLSTTKDRRSPVTLLSAPSNTHVTQVRTHVCRCTSKKSVSWPPHQHRGFKYTPADDCYYQCTDKSISVISVCFFLFL